MKSNPLNALPEKDTPYEIPAEGSLALLALGVKGLAAWRNKRAQVIAEQKKAAKGDDQKDQ